MRTSKEMHAWYMLEGFGSCCVVHPLPPAVCFVCKLNRFAHSTARLYQYQTHLDWALGAKPSARLYQGQIHLDWDLGAKPSRRNPAIRRSNLALLSHHLFSLASSTSRYLSIFVMIFSIAFLGVCMLVGIHARSELCSATPPHPVTCRSRVLFYTSPQADTCRENEVVP